MAKWSNRSVVEVLFVIHDVYYLFMDSIDTGS